MKVRKAQKTHINHKAMFLKVCWYRAAQGSSVNSSRAALRHRRTSSPRCRASVSPEDSTQPHISSSTRQQTWCDLENHRPGSVERFILQCVVCATPRCCAAGQSAVALLKSQYFNNVPKSCICQTIHPSTETRVYPDLWHGGAGARPS